MDNITVVKALTALAQTSRLEVFKMLVVAGRKGITPSEIAAAMGVPANTLSFHLKELMHADLVTQERIGRNLVYRAQIDRMNAVLSYLTENCCQGEKCLDDAAVSCKC
jgi:ArsR family transcriptional regulator, arsenate/arsenite/antimonite-responsive transcriptional repressor